MELNFPKLEEKILKFWKKKKIFEKSVKQRAKSRSFVFYDGPPFATGLPHYGHILSSVIKDVIPRYWTMKGYYVRRRWGWDCHGLPIENLVEKEFRVSDKKDIEKKFGVEKFNEMCRAKVLTYTKEWKKTIDKIGRWVDFDNSYKTMDPTYMESVWWALKKIWDKGLIYEGNRVLMYCPRCETPVSKAEVAMDNSYEIEKDLSAVVKFKIIDNKFLKKRAGRLPCYFLAWTTTPWSLMGTMGLAIDAKNIYVQMLYGQEYYILLKSRIDAVMQGLGEYKIVAEFKGKDIEGVKYNHIYNFHAGNKEIKKRNHLFQTFAVDYVEQAEGTGIVTINPAYGEIDFQSGKKFDLPAVVDITPSGHFSDVITRFAGKEVLSSNELIAEDLKQRNLLLRSDWHEHSYPHCWRCNSKLLYRAISAWFIEIQKNKKRLVELNKKINWYPGHLKFGRFLNILEDAPDWNISRNRYWATPLPFWKCRCGHKECLGSVKELAEKALNFKEVYGTDKVEKMDLHKHKMDKIKLLCEKCGKTMARVPEVMDCWLESASMPFAELHYPFENKELFKKRFPAQFIAEYIAQTRTWFYYMHVMAALLFDSIGFENVVCTGTVLNEKGEKLSKSKKNYTDPRFIIEQYGVDSLRYYLMSSAVMRADDLFFNDKEVRDVYNKVINTLWNVAEFYKMYVKSTDTSRKNIKFKNILDRWILSKLNNLIEESTEQADRYNTVKICKLAKDFIEDLSLWYVRRSRKRFKSRDKECGTEAGLALRLVLLTLSKLIAPILPFISEDIYQTVKGRNNMESVHLENWPKVDKKLINQELEEKMAKARRVVSLALAERAKAGIRLRQPLASLQIPKSKSPIANNLLELMKEEVNVKKINFGKSLKLDTKITPELKEEGTVREIIRHIQETRKKANLKPQDRVLIDYAATPDLAKIINKYKKIILAEAKLADLVLTEGKEKEIKVDNQKLYLAIKK